MVDSVLDFTPGPGNVAWNDFTNPCPVRILYRQPADSRAAPDRALIHGMRKASVMPIMSSLSPITPPTNRVVVP